jgi:putative SbcD/Mre11-related phosphoesterase
MRLTDDVELIDGLPVAHIKSISALAISDLHLGYESALAKRGVFLPNANLKSIIMILTKALLGRRIEKIIVVGDIKNEFSRVEHGELNELSELLAFLGKKGVALTLVKGNHDNFIESYSSHLHMTVHKTEALMAGYLFVHGDKELSPAATKMHPSIMMIGHEHPTISIPTKIGNTERLRCFLYGDYKGKKFSSKILVLPAIGYFETGSDVNIARRDRFMSPLLKGKDSENMEAIAVGYGSTMGFGKIRDLRKIHDL